MRRLLLSKLQVIDLKCFLLFIVFTAVSSFSSNACAALCSIAVGDKPVGQVNLSTPAEYVQDHFPELFSKIQQAENLITNIASYEKPYDSYESTFGWSYRMQKSVWRKSDFEMVDVKYRELIWEIFTLLRDERKVAQYYKALLTDSVLVVVRSDNEEMINKLRNGKIPRFAVLKVLVERQKNRGLPVGKIRTSEEEDFFKAVASGGFYDAAMKSNNIGHGTETHWIQMDYLNPTIIRMTNGQAAEFWKYIATTKEGRSIWARLFDTFSRDFSNPEFFNSTLNEAFPYADRIIDREELFKRRGGR